MTAQLLQGDGTLLAEMDVSTGEAGHRTPKGNFRVTEKMPYKRSNLYGQYVKKDTREVVVARHWEHKGPKPAGTVYQGIAMPYWMRLTAGGVGMHVGQFSRGVTTSKGCIRCPEDGQIFFTNIAASARLLEFTADHTAYLLPLVYHQRVKVRTKVDGSLHSLLFDDHAFLDVVQNGL